MELTRRFVKFGLLATLFIASSCAEIIVQPGYTPPPPHQQNYVGSSVQQNPQPYQQPLQVLGYQLQRNEDLQRRVNDQIRQLNDASQGSQVQLMASGMVGLAPSYHYPPYQTSGHFYTVHPSVVQPPGVYPYGMTDSGTFIQREAVRPYTQQNEVKRHSARSISGDGGLDFGGIPKLHDVASKSPVKNDKNDGVQDLSTKDSADKLVKYQKTVEKIAGTVGSALDKLNHTINTSQDQHHPTTPPKSSSQSMETFDPLDRLINTVAQKQMHPQPGLGNKELMPNANYRQHSPYYQPSSSYWNGPRISSNNQPMTGRPYNNQQPQNLEWNPMTPVQSLSYPGAGTSSENNPYSQQTNGSPPTTQNSRNNPSNSWLTSGQQIASDQFGYPMYQQPGYQNNQNQPQNRDYQGNSNRSPPYGQVSHPYGNQPSHPNGPPAFAANNYNDFYRRAKDGLSGTFQQFRQAAVNQVPSVVNSFVSNPEHLSRGMSYLRRMVGH